ncbi:MAG: Gldg family protein [Bacteroidota bacterium]
MRHASLKKKALLSAGAALALAVLANIVSVRLFGRLDMTRGDLFTLSEASRELMRNLDDRLTVRAYVTEDLPPPYSSYRRALLDKLNEYRAWAGGKLEFQFIDPSGEKGEQEAAQQGIAQAQVQDIQEDKFELKRAYMGLVFLYEDRREVIPLVQNIGSLEYDISSTIRRLVSTVRKKAAFSSGRGEPPLTELTRIQQAVGRQHEVTSVDLDGEGPIPQDVAALVVMAPREPFSEKARFRLDQYLMHGGRIAFLLNKVDADLDQRFGRTLELNIEDMLETYGLRLNPDLVHDAQCARVTIVQQRVGFFHPHLPLVSGFSRDNMMVKDLQGVVLVFASSVDTTELASRGLKGEVLMRSSRQSGRQRQFFSLDPQGLRDADFGEDGIPLGIAVTGRFRSHYASRPAPADTTPGAPLPEVKEESPETRVILIGDGDFPRDNYTVNKDNLTLVANMIDYLADDAGLITIRSKDVNLPPLDQLSDGARKALKYGNLVLPPAAVMLFGLLRWRLRKARRKAMEIS